MQAWYKSLTSSNNVRFVSRRATKAIKSIVLYCNDRSFLARKKAKPDAEEQRMELIAIGNELQKEVLHVEPRTKCVICKKAITQAIDRHVCAVCEKNCSQRMPQFAC
jgi:hypothetical protein